MASAPPPTTHEDKQPAAAAEGSQQDPTPPSSSSSPTSSSSSVSTPVSYPTSPSASPTVTAMSKPRPGIQRSPKILRYIITAYMIIGWFTSFFVSLTVQVVLWILLFPLLKYNPKLETIIMGAAFHYSSSACGFFLNPFWRLVVVKQPPKGYIPSDTLLMVNHTSGADPWITARATFPWELKYIFKGDLLKIPICGWTMRLSGDIPIHFTKAKGGWGTEEGAVPRMMREVKKLQTMGIGEVVFPEGTRSRDGRLQPFKDGFFRFAVENGCEILPCIIHNAQQIWPMGSSIVDMGTVYFAFGEPTRPKEGETVEQLKSRIRNEMIELQKLCPLFDPIAEAPMGENEFTSSRGLGLRGR